MSRIIALASMVKRAAFNCTLYAYDREVRGRDCRECKLMMVLLLMMMMLILLLRVDAVDVVVAAR